MGVCVSCLSLAAFTQVPNYDVFDSRVAQRSKAPHLSARGITKDPGSIPGCITTGCNWESNRVAQNLPSFVWVRFWPG